MSKQPMTERSIEEEQLCFCLMLLKAKENDREGKQEVTVSLAKETSTSAAVTAGFFSFFFIRIG